MAFIAVLLGALACQVAGAQARVIIDPVTHKHFGIVPVAPPGAGSAPGRSSKLKANCSTDCSPLLYGGGPVQHAQHDYLFFWGPNGSLPDAYKTGLARWLDDLAGASADTTPISVTQQYYDNSGPSSAQNFVRFAVQNAGSITDTNPPPANGCTPGAGYSSCLTDGQLQAELTSYISAHNLPTGTDVEYFILTPQGVDTCTDSSSSECASNVFCGYHSTYQLPGSSQSVIYADLPWVYGVSGCTGGAPLNSGFIDPVVGVFSHELSESMTDPNAENGWIDSAGNEIGDKCVDAYGDNLPTLGGAQYNVQLGSDHYLIQTEFSNRTLNCELNMPIPVNSALPGISGQARQASVLTESNGTWTGSPTSFTYQWEACDAQGANCSPLIGATGQTYQPVPGDVGHTIRVAEVAVNPAGSGAPALSAPTAVVLPLPPAATQLPALSGRAQTGSTLSGAHGAWGNSPSALIDRWERCDSGGNACSAIPGANGSQYLLTGADIGHTVRVQETAVNAGGSGTASSGPSSRVIPSAALLKGVLAKAAVTRWRIRLGRVLHLHAASYNFTPPSTGRLQIVVKHAGTVVARGSFNFGVTRPASVPVRPTPQGRKLLKRLKRPVKLQLVVTFTPAGGGATTVSRSFSLR